MIQKRELGLMRKRGKEQKSGKIKKKGEWDNLGISIIIEVK
jgi:hypothetical protein